MKKVIAIIPARGGSKRLPNKNIYPLFGKPLIYFAIEACKRSKYIEKIFVSTEDDEIKRVVSSYGVEVIDRPARLAQDKIWTQDVLKHAVNLLLRRGFDFDIVARIQANSPMVETRKINEAIIKLVKYNLWEIFSVDQKGVEDGAIHILKKDVVFQKAFSVYNGVVQTNYIDVHTKEDLIKIKRRWNKLRKKG